MIGIRNHALPSLYNKILEALNDCGDVILYNWKFAGIDIVPSACDTLPASGAILINGSIQVTELDEITVIGLPPPILPVSPLVASENGVYEAVSPQSGFNPVTVQVPSPVLTPLEVSSNGRYLPAQGEDGFSVVDVSVYPTLVSLTADANQVYYPVDYDADGFGVVSVNVPGTVPQLNFYPGRLTINTGVIDESDEYCYSDLIPITTGSGRWFIDLSRSDLMSYYIGVCFYGDDGVTQAGYIRQYETYRSFATTYGTSTKFFRIANKITNLAYANLTYVTDDIHVGCPGSTYYEGGMIT